MVHHSPVGHPHQPITNNGINNIINNNNTKIVSHIRSTSPQNKVGYLQMNNNYEYHHINNVLQYTRNANIYNNNTTTINNNYNYNNRSPQNYSNSPLKTHNKTENTSTYHYVTSTPVAQPSSFSPISPINNNNNKKNNGIFSNTNNGGASSSVSVT